MNQNCVNNLEPSDLWSRKGSGLTIDAMLPPYNLRVGQEDELTPPWGVTGVWGSKIPCNETSEPLDGLKTPPDSACIAPMVQASPIAKPVTGSLVGEKNTQSVSVDALLALRQPPIPQPGDACPPPPGLVAGLSSFRDGSVEPFPCQTEVPISIGSCGHPDSCSAACRYVKRKGGCREGENCPNCHLCHWQRPKLRAKAAVEEETRAFDGDSNNALDGENVPSGANGCRTLLLDSYVPAPKGSAFPAAEKGPNLCLSTLSMGSVGHPHSCAAACKYHTKKAGCKDGYKCTRCHLCKWSRYGEKTTTFLMNMPNNLNDNIPDPPLVGVSDQASVRQHVQTNVDVSLLPLKVVLPNSHLEDAAPAKHSGVSLAPSMGSLGHPFNCCSPCKYYRRSGGCREGPRCRNCHLCHWSRACSKPRTQEEN